MVRKTFIYLLVLFLLSSCNFFNNENAAQVESLDNNTAGSGVSIPLEQPPVISGSSNSIPVPPPIDANSQINNSQPAINSTITTPTIQNAKTAPKKISEPVNIPRDKDNKPIYNKIDKGFYKGNVYKVQKGDTIFLISYIAGMDIKELAELNNLKEPYTLNVGQEVKLGNYQMIDNPTQAPVAQVTPPIIKQQPTLQTGNDSPNMIESPKTVVNNTDSTQSTVPNTMQSPESTVNNNQPVINSTPTPVPVEVKVTPLPKNQPITTSNLLWKWPTKGKVIQGFSTLDGGNKGIDISGKRGQDIYASAAGKVVYVGNALRGYGNLILIKHNDDYISAYAHNESILVKDQQMVSAGQLIGKMGDSGTNQVKLHFEIRYKAQSVDPLKYLD